MTWMDFFPGVGQCLLVNHSDVYTFLILSPFNQCLSWTCLHQVGEKMWLMCVCVVYVLDKFDHVNIVNHVLPLKPRWFIYKEQVREI